MTIWQIIVHIRQHIPIKIIGKKKKIRCAETTEKQVSLIESPNLEPYLALADAGLAAGIPIEMLHQRLCTLGLPLHDAEEVVETVVGMHINLCLHCNLTYKLSIASCTNCGRHLIRKEQNISTSPTTR